MNGLHKIYIPTSPKEIFMFLKDPNKPILSRKVLVQGETIAILIHFVVSPKTSSYQWFCQTKPVVDLVKSSKIPHSTSLNDEKVRNLTIENTVSILPSDRSMPLNSTWQSFIDSLPNSNKNQKNEPVFFLLPDQSICYLLLQKIGVVEQLLNAQLFLRVTIPPPSVDSKYEYYQDTLFTVNQIKGTPTEFFINVTVIDPIKIRSVTTQSSSGSFLVITLENTSENEVEISNLITTCQYALDKPFLPLPCTLKAMDKYTFAVPVKVPISFVKEIDKKSSHVPRKPLPSPKVSVPTRSLSSSPEVSDRTSFDLRRLSTNAKALPKISTRFDRGQRLSTSSLEQTLLDSDTSLSKKSSILCPKAGNIEPISPSKRRNSLTSFNESRISIGLTIIYSMGGMLGNLFVARELKADVLKYQPITMRISFPQRIKCHRVFRVVFELIYQCNSEKHLTLSITSVDNIQSPVYCLHPTIDIGVFSHPCTSSISVEFLSNKSGLFTFGPIQLKDVISGEIFKMDDSCKILIEP
ncbi:hypothetical protein EDI_226420 [Entamoeba dispar SAW760]|uniref:Trafficking protein particle complex subunit 13 C-terminal domain-containing protein n=1 Tax=Entamoeba dispar (strain ATCC PRA-260 / SAW760) TaxID=370354 RepID=B0EGE0_ENTDS|nr:uncharacterized protein EDI_226420 [Entamoeba dispar SAW760]EDR26416.1 hypothetical protein EDI_226420 [Entamoeba dispar SAW760]|eukprot:EDR26416.1 hypothetical protein EDI_226420 [Entamoeba dispar SAW760]